MERLSKLQTTLYILGGVLMVIGAGCYAFLVVQKLFCWIYLMGSLMFAWVQLNQICYSLDPVAIRLKHMMSVADVLFVMAGLLMVDSAYEFICKLFFFDDRYTYFDYIYNKWVLLLLVAALVELYTIHRLDIIIKKEDEEALKEELEYMREKELKRYC